MGGERGEGGEGGDLPSCCGGVRCLVRGDGHGGEGEGETAQSQKQAVNRP